MFLLYSPVISPSSLELSKPCETPYGKVRELRKQSMDRTKSQDGEGRGRIKSETAATRRRHSVKHFEKSKSFGNVVNTKKPLASSGNQSIEEEGSPENGKEGDVVDNSSVKRLTNLKDFYSLPGQSESDPAEEEEREKEEVTSPCAEVVVADAVDAEGDDPFDWVGYSQANSALTVYCSRLPPPPQFGHGNPFLMFLCLACLLEVSKGSPTKRDFFLNIFF